METSQYIELGLACIRPLGIVALGYMSLIIGFEISGYVNGYRGLGKEVHERNVEAVKKLVRNVFHNNSRRKK